jgi:hypothetical protein
MHEERDPRTSYRVEVIDDYKGEGQLALSVTIYPPASSGENVTVGCLYRYDAIPEWLRISMDLLDLSSTNGFGMVPFFGGRSSNVYWFHAQQVYNNDDRSRAPHAQAMQARIEKDEKKC